MSAQVDTVKRVYELFNELPGEAIVRIQTFFGQESARREFDAL